jgi:hypothetical protein
MRNTMVLQVQYIIKEHHSDVWEKTCLCGDKPWVTTSKSHVVNKIPEHKCSESHIVEIDMGTYPTTECVVGRKSSGNKCR